MSNFQPAPANFASQRLRPHLAQVLQVGGHPALPSQSPPEPGLRLKATGCPGTTFLLTEKQEKIRQPSLVSGCKRAAVSFLKFFYYFLGGRTRSIQTLSFPTGLEPAPPAVKTKSQPLHGYRSPSLFLKNVFLMSSVSDPQLLKNKISPKHSVRPCSCGNRTQI